MIKLKDILLENTPPHILVPRGVKGRLDKLIQAYIANGSKGTLDLTDMNMTKLPDVFKYVNVGGDFYCGYNELTSLEGAPRVGGDFYCDSNELTSLIGAPKSVSGNFACYNNKLTSLEGAPKSVGGGFYCSGNKLTSLEGAPQSVGRDFNCSNNVVKFTEEQVRAVCNVKGSITV